MLWEQEPQASVSTAFLSSPKLSLSDDQRLNNQFSLINCSVIDIK